MTTIIAETIRQFQTGQNHERNKQTVKSSNMPQKLSERTRLVVNRYGDGESFAKKFNPTFQQVLELSVMIRVEYYYLKASELLLFFFKLKTGEYGTFYGVVDPMVIMSALIEFKAYRKRQLEKYDREEQERQREKRYEKQDKNSVPFPDHLEFLKKIMESE